MKIKKFMKDQSLYDLINIFSFTNDYYVEKNLSHVSKAWIYSIICYLKTKDLVIVPKHVVDGIPMPYRTRLEEESF